MINLLPASQVESTQSQRLKRWVMAVTTVVLVGYILALAAVAGGGWYLAKRETVVSTQITTLSSQVGQLAEVEAVLRHQADRMQLIRQVLGTRAEVAPVVARMAQANITDWDYQPTGLVRVTVVGPSASDLEAYAARLAADFTPVTIVSLKRQGGGSWQMMLELVGGKHE